VISVVQIPCQRRARCREMIHHRDTRVTEKFHHGKLIFFPLCLSCLCSLIAGSKSSSPGLFISTGIMVLFVVGICRHIMAFGTSASQCGERGHPSMEPQQRQRDSRRQRPGGDDPSVDGTLVFVSFALCRHLLVGPAEVGLFHPHAVQDHRHFAGHRDLGLLGADALHQPHSPGLQR